VSSPLPTKIVWENGPIDGLHDIVCLEDSVDDRNVLSRDLVDRDVANFVPRVWRIDEEKEVPAVKCGLHRAAIWLEQSCLARAGSTTEGRDDAPEDNNDRRLGVRDQSETLINHKAGRENRRKVQSLKHDLYASTIGGAPSEFRTKGCVKGWTHVAETQSSKGFDLLGEHLVLIECV